MKLKTKKIGISILLTFVLFIGTGYYYINRIVTSGFDLESTVYIYIDSSRNYSKLLNDIETEGRVKDIDAFNIIASYCDYPQNIKMGKYAIKPNMTVYQLVKVLKSGAQTPVKLTFNNIRIKKELVERIGQQLDLQDTVLLTALNDSVRCAQLGFTTNTVIAMFIPNTYQIYWDTSLDAFIKRMDGEYKKFWTRDRLSKAKNEGLNNVQICTLASIVEEECYFTDEYPIVAGLYLNRLKKGMLLQADPTVKFAVGDFSLRRILRKHLETDSPYNTYKYAGLPPGPIRVPSIKAIDAVLNPANHNYYYMCAKDDFSSRHNFASTLAEHQRNAAKYQHALNRKKIY